MRADTCVNGLHARPYIREWTQRFFDVRQTGLFGNWYRTEPSVRAGGIPEHPGKWSARPTNGRPPAWQLQCLLFGTIVDNTAPAAALGCPLPDTIGHFRIDGQSQAPSGCEPQ